MKRTARGLHAAYETVLGAPPVWWVTRSWAAWPSTEFGVTVPQWQQAPSTTLPPKGSPAPVPIPEPTLPCTPRPVLLPECSFLLRLPPDPVHSPECNATAVAAGPMDPAQKEPPSVWI